MMQSDLCLRRFFLFFIADTTWLLSEKWYTPVVVWLIIQYGRWWKSDTIWLFEKGCNLVVVLKWYGVAFVGDVCRKVELGKLMLCSVGWCVLISKRSTEWETCRARTEAAAGRVWRCSLRYVTNDPHNRRWAGIYVTCGLQKLRSKGAVFMCCSRLCETSSCSVMAGLRSLAVSVFYRRSTR